MNKVILDSNGRVFINGHELKNVESISSETNYFSTNISIKFEADYSCEFKNKETKQKEDVVKIHVDLKELTKEVSEAVLQNINDVTVKDSCEEVMEDTTTVYYCIKNGKFLWDTERFEEADFEVIELSNIGKLLDLINEKELSKEDLNLIFNTIKSSVDMR